MATTNVSLEDICKQRRRQLLFTIPPPRNTIQSPYPQYTQQQLDMRRKAEILKYAGNKQNTKTNSLTRSERYAHAMRNRNRVDLTTTVNNVSCPDDAIIYTSSSASGVPGPSIPLYFMPSISSSISFSGSSGVWILLVLSLVPIISVKSWLHMNCLLAEKPRNENLLTCSPPTTDSKRKAGLFFESFK